MQDHGAVAVGAGLHGGVGVGGGQAVHRHAPVLPAQLAGHLRAVHPVPPTVHRSSTAITRRALE
ncbi:MAG: hypothetical protein ACRDSN_04335, partial [Pseudonocardiaceae bacterium]